MSKHGTDAENKGVFIMGRAKLTPELRHVLQVNAELYDVESKIIDALVAWYDFAEKIKRHSTLEPEERLDRYKEIERLLVTCVDVMYDARDSLIYEMPPNAGELFSDAEIGELS